LTLDQFSLFIENNDVEDEAE